MGKKERLCLIDIWELYADFDFVPLTFAPSASRSIPCFASLFKYYTFQGDIYLSIYICVCVEYEIFTYVVRQQTGMITLLSARLKAEETSSGN